MRRPLMAGNWKMFKTPLETRAFFEAFKPLIADSRHADIVIAPPFTALETAVACAQGTAIAIGAQDVFWEKQGAFTGEVSPLMLRSLGCRYVIIGHSERRQYFHETDDTVRRKTIAALELVCALIAPEGVVAFCALEGVGPSTTGEQVRPRIAHEGVSAIGALDVLDVGQGVRAIGRDSGPR